MRLWNLSVDARARPVRCCASDLREYAGVQSLSAWAIARRMGRIRFACDVCNAPLSAGEVCACTTRRSQERPNRPPESPAPPSEPAGPVAVVEKKPKKGRAKKDETAGAPSPDKSLFEAE